ncbi:hypothetical protein [Lysobacter sp. CA199]|uniref:hypothetical protein n=1 Tax=Lysobacter sp. CA199 TaxID=3455608 RepID=UPI003F8D37A9
MTQLDDLIEAAALRYVSTHHGEHLPHDRHLLIQRCAQQLIEGFTITRRAAEDAAMRACSEIHNRGADAFIDLERSSSRMVVLRNVGSRTEHLITVADMLDFVRSRTAAAPAA